MLNDFTRQSSALVVNIVHPLNGSGGGESEGHQYLLFFFFSFPHFPLCYNFDFFFFPTNFLGTSCTLS